MNCSLQSDTGRSRTVAFSTIVGILCAIAGGLVIQHRQLPAPGPAVSSDVRPPNSRSCVDCHEIANDFESVPHAQTLRRAMFTDVRGRFIDQKFETNDGAESFRFYEEKKQLWFEADSYPRPLPVNWLLGSGHHAITPVSTWENAAGETELLELAVSWYPDRGLGLTLGQSPEGIRDAVGIDRLGKRLSHGETLECFGCHSVWLPVDEGRIRFHDVDPGVTCNRCHTGSAKHFASEGEATPPGFSWAELTPLESINRCGSCHRRADQMTAEELTVDNQLLIRFASAAIVQSSCFLNQSPAVDGNEQRLDCLTCHDPHRPASTDPTFYSDQCRKCHDFADSPTACPDLTPTSNCLPCHMPKIEIHPYLSFTDHWIRIRDSAPDGDLPNTGKAP